MKSTKDLIRRKTNSRHCDGMSIVKWLDIKTVKMISRIDNGSPTNTVNVKRRQRRKGGCKSTCNGAKLQQAHERN